MKIKFFLFIACFTLQTVASAPAAKTAQTKKQAQLLHAMLFIESDKADVPLTIKEQYLLVSCNADQKEIQHALAEAFKLKSDELNWHADSKPSTAKMKILLLPYDTSSTLKQ